MFYSKSAKGFYLPEIHGDNMPNDCVEIAEDEHLRLIKGQSQGRQIAPDSNGYPMLIDIPEKAFSELAPLMYFSIRQDREIVLNRIANMATFAGEADKGALALSRQLLLDVTKADAVLAATTVEELEQAFKDEFRLATAKIPNVLNGTFAEVK